MAPSHEDSVPAAPLPHSTLTLGQRRFSRRRVLTSSRKGSVSETLPVATHWKEAFCPALTSTSPSREK